jgi:hypothetical protein
VLVLENPDRFAIRLTEQNSCKTPVSLRSPHPNAPRTSTTTRTIPNFGIWVQRAKAPGAGSKTARRFGFPPPPAHRLGLRTRKIEELIHGPGCFT